MSKNNIINIIFVVCIFILLFIPVTHIYSGDVSPTEKRSLTKYVPLYNAEFGRINYHYGNDFENWLKDRFRGRLFFVYLNSYKKYFLSYGGHFIKFNDICLDRHNGFMYGPMGVSFDKSTHEKLVKNFELFNSYCKKNNIRLYIVVSPLKEMIYTPDYVKNDNTSVIQKNILTTNKDNKINLIFPLEELNNNKSEKKLYYKTDGHSTDDGTFVIYKSLMNKIKQDFPNLKIFAESAFNIDLNTHVKAESNNFFTRGQNCNSAAIPDFICNKSLDVNYRFLKYKNGNSKIVSYDGDKIRKKVYYYSSNNNLKVLVFGDSSTENLMRMLPYSFKEVMKIRFLFGDYAQIKKVYGNEILSFKPDIIVIFVGYNTFGMLKNIMEE